MKYRKKPVVIEAIQYTGDNIQEVWYTFGAGEIYGPVEDDPCAYILTLEGRMRCDVGDWIIKGVQGEFYPCKPDIFAATYESVLTEHLPECHYVEDTGNVRYGWNDCICDELRACEQRVAEETQAAMMKSFHWKPSPPHDQHSFADNICAYCVGCSDAFTAAHKAVAALPEYALRDTCVSAIDALVSAIDALKEKP